MLQLCSLTMQARLTWPYVLVGAGGLNMHCQQQFMLYNCVLWHLRRSNH